MDVKYLLIFSFFLEIQSVEEQRSQFEDVKKQFEDVKKQLEDVKKQFEDTKLQLDDTKLQSKNTKTLLEESNAMYEDTKVQLKDTKTQLEDSKAEISELEKKLAKMVEYAKDPCKNCEGPTVCLDGQFIRITPEHGTMIRAVKDTSSIYKNTVKKVVADDFGTVDTKKWVSPVVRWNTLGNRYCDDFTLFVYKCK